MASFNGRIVYLVTRRTIVRPLSNNSAFVNASEIKPWKDIPGPSSLPIIGPLLHFLPGGSLCNVTTTEYWWKLYEMYGPIVKIEASLGVPATVYLYDPESAAQVLRGENQQPVRPEFFSLEYYRKQYKKTYKCANRTTGLITDQGDVWKQFRSTVNPVLLQPKTIKLYSSVIDEVSLDIIKRLKSLRNDENMIQSKFDAEMNLWALEAIGVVALGGRLNCFDPNLAEDSPAKRLIICGRELLKISYELDKSGTWRYYPTKKFKKAMKLYEEHERLAKYFIDKAKKELNLKNKNSDEEKGILEKLLEIDENVANIMASDMLFAGVDTAANAIITVLYFLAINPEKQTKLRQEILSKQEKKTYLKACIKEAMRIIPVIGDNLRQATKDYNLLGYHIPKGTSIALSHWFMSMDEKNFCKPQDFVPERWLVDKEDPIYYGNGHPFAYSPFGFGIRSCIGRRIAELEVETFLSRLIENFNVQWFGPSPKVTTTSVNYVTGPYNFIFKDA